MQREGVCHLCSTVNSVGCSSNTFFQEYGWFFRTSKYYSVLQVHLRRILSIITSVIQPRLMLEDRAGGGVDLVAVRHAAGLELDLVAQEGSFCISKSSLLLCGFTKRRLCYRLPSPVIRVMHGKDDLLHLESKILIRTR